MPIRKSYICAVGMTAFEKPRNRREYDVIAVEAAVKALKDGGLNYDDIEQAYVGYVYGVSLLGLVCSSSCRSPRAQSQADRTPSLAGLDQWPASSVRSRTDRNPHRQRQQ